MVNATEVSANSQSVFASEVGQSAIGVSTPGSTGVPGSAGAPGASLTVGLQGADVRVTGDQTAAGFLLITQGGEASTQRETVELAPGDSLFVSLIDGQLVVDRVAAVKEDGSVLDDAALMANLFELGGTGFEDYYSDAGWAW